MNKFVDELPRTRGGGRKRSTITEQEIQAVMDNPGRWLLLTLNTPLASHYAKPRYLDNSFEWASRRDGNRVTYYCRYIGNGKPA